MSVERSPDAETAAAFAGSWNRQREGSVYTRDLRCALNRA